MEIEKVKELFFGKYIGQKVCEYTDLINRKRTCRITHFNSYRINDAILNLRSVDKLTDEHYKIIRQIVAVNEAFEDEEAIKGFVILEIIKALIKQTLQSKLKDLLDAMGYLTYFTYLSDENKLITIRPDEIIKLGWAKTA